MSNLMTKPCLVLNASYEPLSIASTKRALKLITKGAAISLESNDDLVIYTSRMWDEMTGDYIDVDIKLPSVIKLVRYRNIPMRVQVLSRKNIYIRDQFTCQYCNVQFSYSALTLDHVHPQSKGGKNSYENLVSACSPCNKRKGDKLLSELKDMKLLRQPKAVTMHTSREILRNVGKSDPKWRKYLYYSSDAHENNFTD